MADDVVIGRIAVKVTPDTSDFRSEVKKELAAIEDSLAALKITATLDASGIRTEAKRAQQEVQQSLGDATIRVNLDDEASLKAAIGRVQRELVKLDEITIDVELDRDGLTAAKQLLDEQLSTVRKVKLEFDPSSIASMQKVIGRLDAELAKLQQLDLDVQLNEADLRAARELMEEQLQKAIQVKLTADNASYARVRAEIDQVLSGIKVNPEIDTAKVAAGKRRIEEYVEQINALRATVTPELDDAAKRKVERQIDDLNDKINKIKSEIEVELKTPSYLLASAKLAKLARDRTVKLIPVVSTQAATAAATALAALSGARSISDMLDDLWQSVKNLDKAAPLIGTVAVAVAGLGAVGIASVSSLASLAASLASIGPAALALPGILGGVTVATAAMIVAFQDFSKRIPEVKKVWTDLKATIQDNFWAQAEKPIRDLIDGLLPEFSAGVATVAGQLGGFFAALATGLGTSLTGDLKGMFDDLSTSIDIASRSAGDIANIIKIVGQTGAGYLPRLAQWFDDVTAKFSDFLTQASQGGKASQLNAWIDTAIQALTDLGNVIVAVGGILGGLGKAATEAGGTVLATMADTLQRVSDVVNSADFQRSLVGVFAAAHAAIDQITSQSGPALEDFFTSFANSLTMILPMAGEAIGKLLAGLADALAQPAFQNGLVDLFVGIGNAVDALTPALGPLGQALGAIGSLLGTFLTALAPNLGAVLTVLAQTVTALAPALQPIVVLLGTALAGAIQFVAPLFAQLQQAITDLTSGAGLGDLAGFAQQMTAAWQPLVPLLGTVLQGALQGLVPIFRAVLQAGQQIGPALGQALAPILSALGPALGQLGSAIGTLVSALSPLVATILPPLGQVLGALVGLIGQVVAALAPFVAKVIEIASAIIGPLVTALAPLVAQFLPQLGDAFTRLVQVLAPVLDILQTVANFIGQYIVPVIAKVVGLLLDNVIVVLNTVVDVVAAMVKNIQGIWDVFAGVFTGDWSRVWTGIKEIFGAIWDGIVAILGGVWQIIVNTFATFGTQAAAQWKSLWDGVQSTASAVWNWLKSAWSSFTGAITGAASAAWSNLQAGFSAVWSAIKATATSAWNSVKSTFASGVDTAVTTVRELPGKAKAALGSVASTLINAGRDLIQGFIDGIKAMFGSVESTLGDLTSKLTDWKGPPSRDATVLTGAGQLVIDGFIAGMESRYDAVRKSLSGLSADISGTSVEAPTVNAASSTLSASVSSALSGNAAGGVSQKILNYYAAPGSSIDSEEDLFAASDRARMVGW